jgi:GNAT superfamily N-acetyltransferase
MNCGNYPQPPQWFDKLFSVEITVKLVPAADIRELRHALLRADLPLSESHFPCDDDPITGAFGAFAENKLVGTATLLREDCPWRTDLSPGWRLRGMAVVPELRSIGIGERLLDAVIAYAQTHNAVVVWCNARLPARNFYLRAGFHEHGEIFPLPGIGPHIRMWRIVN